jgi:hypothetical protein
MMSDDTPIRRDYKADMVELEMEFWNHLVQETNCIGLDSNRPFGNRDVESDILEMIGEEMEGDDGDDKCWSSSQRRYAGGMFAGLVPYLKQKYGR